MILKPINPNDYEYRDRQCDFCRGVLGVSPLSRVASGLMPDQRNDGKPKVFCKQCIQELRTGGVHGLVNRLCDVIAQSPKEDFYELRRLCYALGDLAASEEIKIQNVRPDEN